jgi:hypothetical protein
VGGVKTYFDRVPSRYGSAIEAAWSLLPEKVTEIVHPHFLCGVHPNFVGLHAFDACDEEGYIRERGYGSVAHACFSFHSADRVPRVVLPVEKSVDVIVHEIGHLFDEATGFRLKPPVTTAYSLTNSYELVAEAFQLVLTPPSGAWLDYVSSESFRPFREAMGVA